MTRSRSTELRQTMFADEAVGLRHRSFRLLFPEMPSQRLGGQA